MEHLCACLDPAVLARAYALARAIHGVVRIRVLHDPERAARCRAACHYARGARGRAHPLAPCVRLIGLPDMMPCLEEDIGHRPIVVRFCGGLAWSKGRTLRPRLRASGYDRQCDGGVCTRSPIFQR